MPSRVNDDGSVTTWADGFDPDAVQPGTMSAAAPVVESKVIDPPAEPSAPVVDPAVVETKEPAAEVTAAAPAEPAAPTAGS